MYFFPRVWWPDGNDSAAQATLKVVPQEDVSLSCNKLNVVFSIVFAMCALARVEAANAEQRLAVVNVSFVFEKYTKVPDIQRRIDDRYKAQKDELTQRAGELQKRNKDMSQMFSQEYSSEAAFDAIQRLRRDQFKFEKELNALNAAIQKEYTKEMRDVLVEIRLAVRTVAEKGGFTLVLRSPDTDDPDTVESAEAQNPADTEKRTYLELNAPKTVAQVVERFNRNPVLFGARTVDITKEVLEKLNDDHLRRSMGVQPKK
jgi:Skp family chaperone for outer membrane proteins